jgi:hypothetical protein
MSNTWQQAIAFAKGTQSWTVGMCDQFVARAWGYSSSGYPRAIDHWFAVPANLKHPGDANAPPGSLMFWQGGSAGAGHVALSLGGGNIISTDQPVSGLVSSVPASNITNGWHEQYLGWTEPYFQGQAAGSSGPAGSSSPVTGTTPSAGGTGTTTATDVSSSFLSGFLPSFTGFVKTAIWGTETLIGLALMVFGTVILVRNQVES